MADGETLETDVLIVGAGPAGLAAAYRLAQLKRDLNKNFSVMVIDKAADKGAHQLSGAVLDPKAMAELMPDWRDKGAPVEHDVEEEFVWYLTEHDAVSVPVPPPLQNHGHVIVSLCKFTRWFAGIVEAMGVDLFMGFPGRRLMIEKGRVTGVQLMDKGVGKDGTPRANFEPGGRIQAKVTILTEGVLGTLAREAITRFKLDEGRNPQTYATGVKEIWKLPPGRVPPGRVVHTMGFPLKREYGGSWIYSMGEDKLSIGLVVGLDYSDPTLDIHYEMQRFKSHPKISGMLEGGQILEYGAKAIPSGGFHSIPRLSAPGVLIAGDSGGFVNMMRLKGIHLALKTGSMAADAAFEVLRTGKEPEGYDRAVRGSWVWEELKSSRLYKQGFKGGLIRGIINVGIMQMSGGWAPTGEELRPTHEAMRPLDHRPPERIAFDGRLTHSKLNSVYFSDTHHDEDSPSHLKILNTSVCVEQCARTYGNPCQYFCPANVYEWVKDPKAPDGRVQIGFGNCVHCKTCDIQDPYRNIEWTVPEGEGGPHWKEM